MIARLRLLVRIVPLLAVGIHSVGCMETMGGCSGTSRLSVSPEQSCLDFNRGDEDVCGSVTTLVTNRCAEPLVIATRYVSGAPNDAQASDSTFASGASFMLQESPRFDVGSETIAAKLGSVDITFTLTKRADD